jgi:hypothetical protein
MSDDQIEYLLILLAALPGVIGMLTKMSDGQIEYLLILLATLPGVIGMLIMVYHSLG